MEDVTTLVDFKRLNSSEDAGIPVLPENRRVTDKKGFVIYGLGILIFLPFLIYTLAKADPRRLTHHADDCGNLCGVNNTYLPGISCSGRDYSEKIYYDVLDGCMESCGTNGSTYNQICYPDNQIAKGLHLDESFSRALHNAIHECTRSWWKILFSTIITIALSVLTLVVLRYTTGPLVWSLIIFAVVLLVALTGACWYAYAVAPTDAGGILVLSIIWSVVAFVIITVLLVLMEKIRLIIQLYKEAVKVLAAMPLLMIVPILTTLAQIAIVVAFYVTTFYLASSYDLYQVETYYSDVTKYKYMYSPITWFTMVFNFIIACWASRFFEGIQYMIISGSVGKWYFTKNKSHLDSPVLTSAKVTVKYHLGTVAFGSFLIVAFSLVKAFLKAIFRNVCCRCLVILYCSSVEIIIRFISENSYIQTALHGQTFYKSSKRATNLLLANAKSVIAVNCVGDFIVAIMILVVTIASTAISYSLFMNSSYLSTALPTVICFCLNLIIVCITFATFQAVIDTLLMCFCEDTVMNDGVSRPYFMSRGLMEFVENSKKIYKPLKN